MGETTEYLGKKVDLDAVRKELARRGVVIGEVTKEERDRRQSELVKCLDVVYWVTHYCKTYDPRLPDPYIPFDLYDRQIEFLRWLEEMEGEQQKIAITGEVGTLGCCVEKSKDVGVSWLLCDFMLHRWIFKNGFAGGLGSRKLEYVDSIGDPKSLFEKIRMTVRMLPEWMQPPKFDWKKNSFECRMINPDAQSSLVGEGGVEIGRGGRTSIYVVDEYNHLEHPELADAALRDNAGLLVYAGTPNGMVGIYEKRDHWPTFRFHWKSDPRKNYWEIKSNGKIELSGKGENAPEGAVYPWYQRQLERHRDQPWIVKQEIDISYLGSGQPRYDREFLGEYKKNCPEPILVEEPGHGWSGTVKTWKYATPKGRYLIVADVAEGIQNPQGDPDRSVAHVYDVDTWEQVCSYAGRPDTHSYAMDLANLGEMYNTADIAVERNGVGVSTISTLTEEIMYPCIWSEMVAENRSVVGVRAGRQKNLEMEKDLEGIIADMREGFAGFVWNDPQTVDEIIHIVVKPTGRAEAEGNWHDDHHTCCRMAAGLLPQVTTRRNQKLPIAPPKPVIYYGQSNRRYH